MVVMTPDVLAAQKVDCQRLGVRLGGGAPRGPLPRSVSPRGPGPLPPEGPWALPPSGGVAPNETRATGNGLRAPRVAPGTGPSPASRTTMDCGGAGAQGASGV